MPVTMEHRVFGIFIDHRGHHRKAVAIYYPLKSIYNQNLSFIEQKCSLSIAERFKQKKYIT